jgi:enoyl-CoA hydratase
MIDAQEALRLGLVNRIVPAEELVGAAFATANTIASMGPLAIARVKEVLHDGANQPLPEANLLEQEAFAGLFASADQTEGMTAFLEKRAPKFNGK